MFRLTTFSIRSLLLLITFVVSLPAVVIITYSGIHYRNEQLSGARIEAAKLADRIVSEQQSLAVGAEQLMAALAQLPEVKRRDRARVEPILRKLLEINPVYFNLFIADQDGDVWAEPLPHPPFSVADRRYFRNAVASGNLSSGELVLSRLTSQPTFSLGYPVKNDHGQVVGVIGVAFALDQYRQLMGRMKLPKGSSFVLLDHKGTTLTKGLDQEPFLGKAYPADLFRKMKEGPEAGTAIKTGIAGDKRIISYRKLSLAREQVSYLYVMAEIPVDAVIIEADRALMYNMALLMSFLALACLIAVLIGKRSLIDRFRVLEDASRRLAAGDLQVRVSDLVAGGELGNLGRVFDAMAQELAKREAERDRLMAMLETTTDVVGMASPEGGIFYLNRAGRDLIGIGDQPIMGTPLLKTHPDWAAEIVMNEGIPTAVRDGGWKGETALLDRQGREIPVSQIILAHRDARGDLSYLSTIQRDISDRKKNEEILEHSRNLLNETQELSHVGSWQWEIATNTLDWSDELFRIFGYEPGSITRSIDEFGTILHPDDRERVLASVRKASEQGSHYREEYRICRPDGTERIVFSQGELKRDENGRPLRMIGSMMDITERREAEESLYITQFAVEKSADAVFWIARDASFFNVNEAACRLLEYTRDELLTMGVFDIDPVFARDEWESLWERMRSHEPVHLETVHRTKGGRDFPVELISNAVEYAGKECHCAFVRDISERKRMEGTLRESEALFRSVVDSIPFDIFVIDHSGRYRMQSPVSISLWGSVIGKKPEEVFIDGVARNRWLENNRLALDGKTAQGEVDYLVNDTLRHFIEIVTPIRTDDGEIIGILGINIDQTERKLAEEERQHLEEQLIQAQKLESIGRLAGGVAHDFNNLLTPIIIYSELMEEELRGNEKNRLRAENILNAAERAKELVKQLLSFSRKQVLEMKIIDLNQVITGFQSILRHAIRENIGIRFCLVEGRYSICADRNQIEQVIMNLAVNAQDAISGHGLITIETVPVQLDDEYARQHSEVTPGRYLMLAVTDDGCGMAPEIQQRIFEPFFTTKEIGKGTGLGLATVYGIVRQHGGNIWVYSEPNRGTTFKCYFPIVDELPACQLASESAPVMHDAERRTILLAEDDVTVRSLVEELLTLQGFDVLVAENPKQALEMCGSRSIELLITDVVMPDMTGPELYSRLMESYPGIKVLYMSGYTGNVIAHQGVLDEGINFIPKPFTAQDLARKIKEVLSS